MKKFMVYCSSARVFYLAIAAPTEEAADLFYQENPEVTFHRGGEFGWEFDNLEDLPEDAFVDFTVNEVGEIVQDHQNKEEREDVPVNGYTLGCTLLYGLELAQQVEPDDLITSKIVSTTNGGPDGTMLIKMEDGTTFQISCTEVDPLSF